MRRYRFLAMLMVGALALSVCGGDDDDHDSASTEEEASDDDSEDTSEDESEDESEDDSEDESGDDDDSDFDADETEDALDLFTSEGCAEALTAYAGALASAGTGGAFGGDESLEVLEDYADNAPEEIRDDLRIVYTTVIEYYQALEDSGFDLESGELGDLDELAELSEAFNDSGFQEASENVNEWFTTECAVE